MTNKSIKIDLKLIKIAQQSLLEWSRAALGGYWRPIPNKEGGTQFFFTLLGAVLVVSWPVLAASRTRLGRLGVLLGPSWARLGGQNQTQSQLNLDAKMDHLYDAF